MDPYMDMVVPPFELSIMTVGEEVIDDYLSQWIRGSEVVPRYVQQYRDFDGQ